MNRVLLLLPLMAFLISCATKAPIEQRDGSLGTLVNNQIEMRLIAAADDYETQIQKSGSLIQDEISEDYLQSILDRLYPDLQGMMRVYVVNSSDLNAFVLPNGSVYVNVGLLARLDNEAQLATVLAHEGAHYVDRHALRQRNKIKSSEASRLLLAITGIPLLPELISASSLYGFSRELENKADQDGFKRLLSAGYDTKESTAAFQRLLEEVQAYDIRQPWFFATHPSLRRRIANYQKLHETSGSSGEQGVQAYQENLAAWQILVLEQDLKKGRYQSILAALDDSGRRGRYPPESVYYLAEAYRLRGEEGDAEKALQYYQQLLKTNPQHALTHRALGVWYFRHQAYRPARRHLEEYLSLNGEDDAYVVSYLEQIASKLGE